MCRGSGCSGAFSQDTYATHDSTSLRGVVHTEVSCMVIFSFVFITLFFCRSLAAGITLDPQFVKASLSQLSNKLYTLSSNEGDK